MTQIEYQKVHWTQVGTGLFCPVAVDLQPDHLLLLVRGAAADLFYKVWAGRWSNFYSLGIPSAHNDGGPAPVLVDRRTPLRFYPGLNPPSSPTALDRMERDVLSRAGVTHVIFFEGSNDLARGASFEQITAGLTQVYARAKAARLKIIGATVIPRHNAAWRPEFNPVRHAVNAWIRANSDLDAVLDFDALLKDPTNPDLINPAYDSGDHIHPGPAGYAVMGNAIDLVLFENIPKWAVGR